MCESPLNGRIQNRMSIVNPPIYLDYFEDLVRRKASKYEDEEGDVYRLDDDVIIAISQSLLYGCVYDSLELPNFNDETVTGNNDELFYQVNEHLPLVKTTLGRTTKKVQPAKEESKSRKTPSKKSRR
jgi:hypothetical protein